MKKNQFILVLVLFFGTFLGACNRTTDLVPMFDVVYFGSENISPLQIVEGNKNENSVIDSVATLQTLISPFRSPLPAIDVSPDTVLSTPLASAFFGE